MRERSGPGPSRMGSWSSGAGGASSSGRGGAGTQALPLNANSCCGLVRFLGLMGILQ